MSKDPTQVVATDQTPTDRLSLLKSRLALAKAFCKKPHKAWKNWISEYEIDDIDDTEEIRDKVRIGYVFRRVESDLPAIFDDQPELFFKGKKGSTRVLEPLFEGTYDWLWDVQNLEEKIEDAATYFLLLGMGFIDSPWVTKTKKVTDPTTGQEYDVPIIDRPDARVPNPFKLYFSPETIFNVILDYEHCPYYFEERSMTKEWIKAEFGKDITPSEKLKTDDTEVDQEIDQVKESQKDDIQRSTVYKYVGCLPENLAKGIEGEPWHYDKEYQIYFTNSEELKVEELPYDTKPLRCVGNYGLANKFFKFGDAKHLMPLIQEYEQYRSQILKYTRKLANPKPLIPTEADIDEDAFNDPRPGRSVKYANGTAPSYLAPSGLGQEVIAGANLSKTDMEQQSGSFNLENGSNQSTVKTPRGIQVFSEAADKNVRRKRKKIARFIRQLILFQFKQLAQNWKPEDNHTIDVINPDHPDGAESTPVTAEVLQVLGDDDILSKLEVEVESLSINRVQMKQDALDLFDLAVQHPEVFNLQEMAKDLLQNGFNKKDADRYLTTEEQRKAMSQVQPEPPKVNVSIKADATTAPGAALLENEGLMQPGQGQEAAQVAQAQTMQQNQITSALNTPPQPIPTKGGMQ